jgi:hypothetical protein
VNRQSGGLSRAAEDRRASSPKTESCHSDQKLHWGSSPQCNFSLNRRKDSRGAVVNRQSGGLSRAAEDRRASSLETESCHSDQTRTVILIEWLSLFLLFWGIPRLFLCKSDKYRRLRTNPGRRLIFSLSNRVINRKSCY